MKPSLAVTLFVAVAILPAAVSASSYGRTKIQVDEGPWWVVSTEAVTVYFLQGSEAQAESLIAIAERELEQLTRTLDYRPGRPIPVILYTNPASFRQTEIISGELGEAVGGVTEFFKGRVVVPFTGSWTEFRHVVSHELNHAFIYDMLFHRSIENILYSRTPLWALEGLAEYTSLGWDAQSDGEFKDMVIGEEIVSVQELGNRQDFLVYRQGQAIYHFMAERYGIERLQRFVGALDSDRGLEGALDEALGISLELFDSRFQTWARETYWPRLGWQESPDDLGHEIREGSRSICQAGPVLSRGGESFAGVEQHHASFVVAVRSAYTGRVEHRYFPTEGLGDRSISYLYRICSFSPSGDSLVVARHDIDVDFLSICCDGESWDLEPRFDLIRDPAWSPDGRSICFSGMSEGDLDLYLYELDSRSLRQLTSSPEADLYPEWNEGSILYVSECEGYNGSMLLELDPATVPGQ